MSRRALSTLRSEYPWDTISTPLQRPHCKRRRLTQSKGQGTVLTRPTSYRGDYGCPPYFIDISNHPNQGEANNPSLTASHYTRAMSQNVLRHVTFLGLIKRRLPRASNIPYKLVPLIAGYPFHRALSFLVCPPPVPHEL